MIVLNNQMLFPPVHLADEEGLLCIGGDLKVERLLLAYRCGIFPWYNEGEPILWWSPDPRFVLFPAQLKVSKSMATVMRSNRFRFTINRAFAQVVENCKNVPRDGQSGTWISQAVKDAYVAMHQAGHAHSAEAWMDGELVGGVYGIRIGKVFYGESMFSKVSNASKYAFVQYVRQLQREGVALIDCQVYTAHLESLGAEMIQRDIFIQLLQQHCQ